MKGDRQTDGFPRPAFIRHHQVCGQGIQAALNVLHQIKKMISLYVRIWKYGQMFVPLRLRCFRSHEGDPFIVEYVCPAWLSMVYYPQRKQGGDSHVCKEKSHPQQDVEDSRRVSALPAA